MYITISFFIVDPERVLILLIHEKKSKPHLVKTKLEVVKFQVELGKLFISKFEYNLQVIQAISSGTFQYVTLGCCIKTEHLV